MCSMASGRLEFTLFLDEAVRWAIKHAKSWRERWENYILKVRNNYLMTIALKQMVVKTLPEKKV